MQSGRIGAFGRSIFRISVLGQDTGFVTLRADGPWTQGGRAEATEGPGVSMQSQCTPLRKTIPAFGGCPAHTRRSQNAASRGP